MRKILISTLLFLFAGIELMAQPATGRCMERNMPCQLLQGVTTRVYNIYLPGCYDEQSASQLPVLYLMHGGGESHTVWQRNGRLSEVADSLIACGAIEPMIIVCPEANENNMIYFNAPHWRYEDFFFQEFVPYIEKTYHTRTDKQGRAIAGFSMGGGCATVYGVHHPELFTMVYDISGYQRRQEMEWLKNDPSAEWRQQVIEDNNPIKRILAGTPEEVEAWKTVDWNIRVGNHDFTLEHNMDLVAALRRQGIENHMYVSDGTHNWLFVAPAMTEAIKRAHRNFKGL